MSTTAYDALHDLLCRFQQAFDTHDWDLLRQCLTARIYTDYSSLRGTPPAVVPRDEYVALRAAALTPLRMQHNFSNLRITADGTAVSGRCNFSIYRFAAASSDHPDEFFHSFGHYVFAFEEEDGVWKIAGITQVLLANQGDLALHAGVRAR